MTPTASPAAAVPPPAPPTGLMTAAEFLDRYENVRAELVEGVVKELPMPGLEHGKICALIARLIGNHVEAHDLGYVMSNDAAVQTGTSPDTVRGGDVLFYSYERLPKGSVPKGLGPTAPDLVVEVRSPSDRWNEVFTKVVEYLKVGVRAVIVLDPKTATATVYRDDELQQIFDNGDPLTLPDVLPGFAVEVGKLFK